VNAPPPMLVPDVFAGLKDISGTWQQFMGIPTGSDAEYLRGIADYAKAPADEAWVYRCMSLKAFFAQATPLRVYVKSGKERIPAEDSGDAAAEDLQFLLDDVNPVNMTGGDLKAFSNAATSIWGENYVRKVRGRLGGPPQELYWLRAPDLTPNRGRVWIDTYDYRDWQGGTENYAVKDVIAWRRINLKDPTRGLSPLSSVRYEVSFNRNLAEKRTTALVNWNVPPGAWVIPKDAEFTTQDKTLVQRVLGRLRGPKGSGKVPILPAGMTWQNIALTSRDAEEIASGKVSRMAVCSVEGVPLVLAGDDEKTAVYRNMADAERIFARYMISELDWTAEGYNNWLVPDFDPTRKRLVVAFDYSQIEALQAPLEDRKRVALSEIEHAARTPDEYRAEFRTGQPLPDGKGDQLMQLQNLIPYGVGPEAAPTETTAPPSDVPVDDGTDTIRELSRAVRDYRRTGAIEPIAALLGVPPSDATLRDGMARRYSAAQLLDGVPAENFPGLRTRIPA
jgi:HK97 family phage portal protein